MGGAAAVTWNLEVLAWGCSRHSMRARAAHALARVCVAMTRVRVRMRVTRVRHVCVACVCASLCVFGQRPRRADGGGDGLDCAPPPPRLRSCTRACDTMRISDLMSPCSASASAATACSAARAS